ncbi:UDP-glucose iridoid glucosyltransferase-like [Durio zibethinus]|uniref:UDP-glucose iridoid glucosyltransferase-like n=1 Tax=Durio zibethinus TaxID=66656 RepID=A0A6P5ZMP5_DURZI|nr:UDP-glucose iridoid glucosyltransferase-like [Durio zibethinus]
MFTVDLKHLYKGFYTFLNLVYYFSPSYYKFVAFPSKCKYPTIDFTKMSGETEKAMEKLQKSGHLVLVMFPFQGHITPMLQLAAILHSQGFSITIVHPEVNSPNPSNHPEFTFIPIPDKLTESEISDRDLANFALRVNNNCAAPFQECMKRIMHQKDSHDHISSILYDTFMYCAQTVADDLSLPGISVRTSVAASLLLYPVLPHLDRKDSFSANEVPEFQSLQLQQNRALLSQNSTDAVTEVRVAFTNGVKSSSAIIVNTMDFLEQAVLSKIKEYFPAPIFTVGPFHKLAQTICSSLRTEDANCISWLNKQAPKSVIYVSFGSLASIDEQELIETAWGLADSKQPFLWVVRPGLIRGSEWIESLPNGLQESVGERGYISKWVPQKEVLAHAAVGGFWSHCGWNSTIESICEGVPMLCKPFFGDQFLNSNYICQVWKIGLKLQDTFERGNIEAAIKRLMVDMEGEEMRKNAMDLKEKAELRLSQGGSSWSSLNEFTKQILL